jgi:hypothetical protein
MIAGLSSLIMEGISAQSHSNGPDDIIAENEGRAVFMRTDWARRVQTIPFGSAVSFRCAIYIRYYRVHSDFRQIEALSNHRDKDWVPTAPKALTGRETAGTILRPQVIHEA